MQTRYADSIVRTTTATSWQSLCLIEPGQAATIRCRIECEQTYVASEFELRQTPEHMVGVLMGAWAVQSFGNVEGSDRIYREFEVPIVYPDVSVMLFFRSPTGATVEVSRIQLDWDPDDNKHCQCGLRFKDHVIACVQMETAVRRLRELGPANVTPTIWDRLLHPGL